MTQHSTLDRQVRDLPLKVRTRNVLFCARIHTVRDLIEWTARDLLREPYAGRVVVEDVRKALGALGLALQGETAEPS